MVQILSKPGMDAAAGTLLRAWLLSKHKQMLIDFLDALGIKNEAGVVDDLPETVDETKLKLAIETLLSNHPHEAVAVYLNAFNEMNQANWANLKQILESDSRLQFGSH